jgi:hypothetical protein
MTYKITNKDGKWVLVEVVTKPRATFEPDPEEWKMYHSRVEYAKTIPTLPSDAPYWQSKANQVVKEGEFELKETQVGGVIEGTVNNVTTTTKHFRTYAIPPKEDDCNPDNDWCKVIGRVQRWMRGDEAQYPLDTFLSELKSLYSLKPKQ